MGKSNLLSFAIYKYLAVTPRYITVPHFARSPLFCQNVLHSRDPFLALNANWTFREFATQKLAKKVVPADDQLEMDSDEYYRNYDSLEGENEKDRKKAKNRLQRLFESTLEETEEIIQKNPGLLSLTTENITENMDYFEKLGLKTSVVIKHPWLLTLRTTAISVRLPYFLKMGLKDINVIAPLLYFPMEQLKRACFVARIDNTSAIPGGNRINYLSQHLQNDPIDMWKTAIKHQFLFTMPFKRLSTNLELLLQYGMSPVNILKDVWVFRYQPTTVEYRLKQVQEAGVQILKPWMVRCPDPVLEITLRRTVNSRITLGSNASVLEYLSQRLECNIDDVIALSKRYPPLLKVHILKLKEVLDYLYEEGFTPLQVCQVPRVLCNSLETLQERLNQIRDLGHNPASLIVLCRSKRQYSDYINKLTSLQKQTLSD